MNEHLKDPFFDYHAHLKVLPDHVLRDLARNDCADWEYRKHAVEVLHVRKSPLVHHPDLHELRMELEAELNGLQFEYPDESEIALFESAPIGAGPLVASVTTKTMFSDGPVPELSTIDLDLSTIDLDLSTPPAIDPEVFKVLEETQKAAEQLSGSDPILISKPKRTYTKKPKEPVDAAE